MEDNFIKAIEEKTDFDVLNNDEFSIDVINRYDSDGKVYTVQIYGKTRAEIINYLKCI